MIDAQAFGGPCKALCLRHETHELEIVPCERLRIQHLCGRARLRLQLYEWFCGIGRLSCNERASRPPGDIMTKVLVLYYSSFGHMEQMAYAAAEGAREGGVEAVVKRVSELVPEVVARSSHFKLDQPAPIATVDEL